MKTIQIKIKTKIINKQIKNLKWLNTLVNRKINNLNTAKLKCLKEK